MFPHNFKVQRRIETIDGQVETDELVITRYSPNGVHELDTFTVKKYDVAGLIKVLQPFA